MKQFFFCNLRNSFSFKYENNEYITLKDRYSSFDVAKQTAHKYNKELAKDDHAFNLE